MNVPKEKSRYKSVLLISGGLDSYLTYRLFSPDVLLYCDLNHRYAIREKMALDNLGLWGRTKKEFFALRTWERKDGIIPLRNLLLVCAASRYGDIVWLASLAGEINSDKSSEFYTKTEEVLRICYQSSYWCKGRLLSVDSPVSTLTKAELIRTALLNGVSKEEIGLTVSCYAPKGFCGQCSSCFKRAVATKLNGWVEDYKTNPFKTKVAKESLQKALKGVYVSSRTEDIIQAMEHKSMKSTQTTGKGI